MRIAVVNPSDEFEMGVKGGNQIIAEALAENIKKHTNHEVTTIFTPLKVSSNLSLLKSYFLHRMIDLSGFDMVISLKFPSFSVKHKNHICYFAHFFRQFYDLWPEFSKNANILTKLTRITIKSIDKKAFKKIKKVYSYSEFIKSRLKESGIDSELIYCPPVIEDYKTGNYEYILSTSILNNDRKRISLLIKAMDHIKEDINLIIVGDGPHKDMLQNLAKNNPRIIFLGYQSPKKLVNLYSNALCTCLVSYREDYGLVTIESMKSKKPVITCVDSGGPLEFVEHGKTGLISNPNPKEIAENIEFLIENRDVAKNMGEKAYEKVKNITWKNLINKMIVKNGF
ncbi:glycosyltransferase [Candidatus Pacearchaeota archaeon]|nr:glycosyltransferase [Candidatus Pacearchaeota archaeon]